MKDELKKQGQRGENCDQLISFPSPPTCTCAHTCVHVHVSHIHIHLAAAQSPGKSISGLQNRLLATISEDIGRMQTSQKENFAEVIGREKENRSSTAELFERVGGLSRDFKSVEGDLSNVRRDMTGVKDLVDDLRGNFGRISGWIHEVEGVVGGDRGRIEVLGNQMMELQVRLWQRMRRHARSTRPARNRAANGGGGSHKERALWVPNPERMQNAPFGRLGSVF